MAVNLYLYSIHKWNFCRYDYDSIKTGYFRDPLGYLSMSVQCRFNFRNFATIKVETMYPTEQSKEVDGLGLILIKGIGDIPIEQVKNSYMMLELYEDNAIPVEHYQGMIDVLKKRRFEQRSDIHNMYKGTYLENGKPFPDEFAFLDDGTPEEERKEGTKLADWLESFEKKRVDFISFLEKAIELNEPIIIRW